MYKRDSRSGAAVLHILLFARRNSLYEKDAGQVLHLSDKKQNGGLEQRIAAFENKIVLLGGTYGSCDRHFTPIGTLPGLMVLANAIQTETNGPSVKAYPLWLLFVFEFLASAVLVLLFEFFPLTPWEALVWGLVVSAALALVFSFRMFSYFANFAPTRLPFLFLKFTRTRAMNPSLALFI